MEPFSDKVKKAWKNIYELDKKEKNIVILDEAGLFEKGGK